MACLFPTNYSVSTQLTSASGPDRQTAIPWAQAYRPTRHLALRGPATRRGNSAYDAPQIHTFSPSLDRVPSSNLRINHAVEFRRLMRINEDGHLIRAG